MNKQQFRDSVSQGIQEMGFDIERSEVKNLINNFVELITVLRRQTKIIEKLDPSPDTVEALQGWLMTTATREFTLACAKAWTGKKYQAAAMIAFGNVIARTYDEFVQKGMIVPPEAPPEQQTKAPPSDTDRTPSGLYVPKGSKVN